MGGSQTGGTGGGNTGGTGGATGGTGGGTPDGGGGDMVSADPCTPAAPMSLFCMPQRKMPMSIKDTGLFPAALKPETAPKGLLHFRPDPELWSNGLGKERYVLLPRGANAKIDTSNRDQWVYPAGTIFIKTFYDDSGPGGTPKPIETRFIRQSDNLNIPFQFYTYQWNADSTDATLLYDDIEGDTEKRFPVMVTIKRMVDGQLFQVNGGQPFMHTIPSRKDCGDCHEASGQGHSHFIGFDETRLNSKRTPTAAKTQLQEFHDMGLFKNPMPTDPATITDTRNDGGRMQRIKRFVFGNCVHCHYEGGQQFDLHPKVFEMVTVNQDTMSQSVEMPAGWKRVLPGDPNRSVLYVQMRRTMLPPPVMGVRLRPMPPVGVEDVAAEQRALTDVAAWIMSLPRP